MVRTRKEPDVRRGELLDAAEQLFAQRGYASTPVQAVIDAVGVSKGAFYHHFSSKSELLDALIRRLLEGVASVAQQAVAEPGLSAPERMLLFFRLLDAIEQEQQPLVVDLSRALREEGNALLHQRHTIATEEALVPVLELIIEQGVVEGAFETSAPALAARLVWRVVNSLSDVVVDALLEGEGSITETELQAIHDVHAQAAERILGAEEGWLSFADPASHRQWAASSGERGQTAVAQRAGKHRRASQPRRPAAT